GQVFDPGGRRHRYAEGAVSLDDRLVRNDQIIRMQTSHNSTELSKTRVLISLYRSLRRILQRQDQSRRIPTQGIERATERIEIQRTRPTRIDSYTHRLGAERVDQ